MGWAQRPKTDSGRVSEFALKMSEAPPQLRHECDVRVRRRRYPRGWFRFTLAKLVRNRLHQDGIRVVMTRRNNSGVGPCLNRRVAIGTRVGADVVLSRHADGNQSSETGFHVVRPGLKRGYNDGIQKDSDRFASDLRDQLEKNEIGRSTYIGRGAGIDRRRGLAGLDLSHVPVALVEIGSVRSPRDAALMEPGRWRGETAEQLARAVVTYLATSSH